MWEAWGVGGTESPQRVGRQELWNGEAPEHFFCGKAAREGEGSPSLLKLWGSGSGTRPPGSVSSSVKWVNEGLG